MKSTRIHERYEELLNEGPVDWVRGGVLGTALATGMTGDTETKPVDAPSNISQDPNVRRVKATSPSKRSREYIRKAVERFNTRKARTGVKIPTDIPGKATVPRTGVKIPGK